MTARQDIPGPVRGDRIADAARDRPHAREQVAVVLGHRRHALAVRQIVQHRKARSAQEQQHGERRGRHRDRHQRHDERVIEEQERERPAAAPPFHDVRHRHRADEEEEPGQREQTGYAPVSHLEPEFQDHVQKRAEQPEREAGAEDQQRQQQQKAHRVPPLRLVRRFPGLRVPALRRRVLRLGMRGRQQQAAQNAGQRQAAAGNEEGVLIARRMARQPIRQIAAEPCADAGKEREHGEEQRIGARLFLLGAAVLEDELYLGVDDRRDAERPDQLRRGDRGQGRGEAEQRQRQEREQHARYEHRLASDPLDDEACRQAHQSHRERAQRRDPADVAFGEPRSKRCRFRMRPKMPAAMPDKLSVAMNHFSPEINHVSDAGCMST